MDHRIDELMKCTSSTNRLAVVVIAAVAAVLACVLAATSPGLTSSVGLADDLALTAFASPLPCEYYLPMVLDRWPPKYYLPLVAKEYPVALARLENGGYGSLAVQLRVLPEIADGVTTTEMEALEDIVALAVDATDPEVGEALDLMVSGGMGDDLVGYGPGWNTQLEILFWLAQQNEFRPNDTLALAVAMSNGIWVAMGDDQVDQTVRTDAGDLLSFHRTHNPQVEDYPFEALLALAWRGNYSVSPGREPNHLSNLYVHSGFGPLVYNWNTPDDLEPYRDWRTRRWFVLGSTAEVVSFLERWLYWHDFGVHWAYASGDDIILVDGYPHVNHDIGNPDFTLTDLLEDDVAVGDCGDETTIVSALLSSIGIPSMPVAMQAKNVSLSHYWAMYYEPETGTWKSFPRHLDCFIDRPFVFHFYVYRPPARHSGFLDYDWYGAGEERYWDGGMVYRQELLPGQVKQMLSDGIPTLQIKDWMLR